MFYITKLRFPTNFPLTGELNTVLFHLAQLLSKSDPKGLPSLSGSNSTNKLVREIDQRNKKAPRLIIEVPY